MRVNLALPFMHAGISRYRQKSHPVGRDWCAFHQSAEWQNRVRRIDQMRVNLALPIMHAGISRYRQKSHPVGRDWCAFHQSAEWQNRVRRGAKVSGATGGIKNLYPFDLNGSRYSLEVQHYPSQKALVRKGRWFTAPLHIDQRKQSNAAWRPQNSR